MLLLTRLVLTDFRTYAALTWRPGARITVLTGPNGSGKTNLLEAISLLGPGRGFGRGRMADLARRGGTGQWAVAGRLAAGGSPPISAPAPCPAVPTGACSGWTVPSRAARRRWPPVWPRSG